MVDIKRIDQARMHLQKVVDANQPHRDLQLILQD
jgi:hypothetical protein